MATPTKAKATAHRSKVTGLRLPGVGAKGKSKAKDGGPQPVGPARARKRAKPNPILLGGLALVAVGALGRMAMPGLLGGGGPHAVASFPAPLTDRHLVTRRSLATATGPTTPTTAGSRPQRNPFDPPPGFGP
jgi:hypothetical protein